MTLDLLIIGLAITLEPIPLTAFILALSAKGGVRKGAAFLFGWLVSLAAVIALTILATSDKPPKTNTQPSLALLAVKIAIGVGLLVIGIRRRSRMGKPKKPKKPPKWQTGIDNMSPWLVVGLAPLVQPWGLVAAGMATIAQAKLSSPQTYLAVVLFCLVSTAVYLVLELYALFRPENARSFLSAIRTWIDTHTDQVIIVVSVALGLWLVGKSAYLLAT
jgi:threonine/homoserine/homoserine lactone efflux protein